MAKANGRGSSERTESQAREVLGGRGGRRGLAKLLPFLGPAFIASVAYIEPGGEGAFLAAGIVGATVMPHAIYLHSALTQNRIRPADDIGLKRLFRFEIVDVIIAMGIASFVNAAMLAMSASAFHFSGHPGVATIEDAFVTLKPLLGNAASLVFGVSLLASGLSSSSVGTSAGQVIMQGFVRLRIPIWVRRAVTVLPSLLVIISGVDATLDGSVAFAVARSWTGPLLVVPVPE